MQEKEILRYMPNPAPPPLERVERYIARQLAHWEAHGYSHWAMTGGEDGQLLGWCGLEFLPELNETEVAYLLARRAWRRPGY